MKVWRRLVMASLLSVPLASSSWGADLERERLQNWHQWRGPNADGAAVEADPPLQWSEEQNIQWKVRVPGKGSASPIVWNDLVFVLTAIETDRTADEAEVQASAALAEPAEQPQQPGRGGRGFGGGARGGRGGFGGGPPPSSFYQFVVICHDRNTGDVLWQQVAAEEVPHESGHQTNTFASASPITNGELVFANFGSRGLYCYDVHGNFQWKRDFGRMRTANSFGEGSSPALHGDTLVVPWDHEDQSALYALDAKSGETRWQVERDEGTTWGTPLVVEANGRTQVIMNGRNRVVSYDLTTGGALWECGGQASNPIPSPLRNKDLVYCTTGFRGYAVYAIPLDASGDITGTDKVAWHRSDAGSYVASPVLYDGLLYFTKGRDAILFCVDAETGEPLYGERRLSGSGLYASLVAAAGRVYVTMRDGTTMVIKHGPEMEVLATNKLGEGVDASPAIAGKQMFIRGAEHLYCIEQQ